jgi:hypothetical protein
MDVIMAPGLRKFALIVHLVFSVGWIGAVVVYLVLGISAVTNKDAQTVRAAWIAMELTGWSAIVPLALGSLLTGLVMELGTPWGLFRQYWVLITLVLTLFSTVVLLLHMPTVSALAHVAREADGAVLGGLGGDGRAEDHCYRKRHFRGSGGRRWDLDCSHRGRDLGDPGRERRGDWERQL